MANEDLRAVMARPYRYDSIDGTMEFGFGVMYLAFALLGYLQSILPADSVWNRRWLSLLFMYLVVMPLIGLGFWTGKLIKRYITWPRTGYVAYRNPAKSRVIVFFSALIAAAVVTFFAVRLSKGHDTRELGRVALIAGLLLPYGIFLARFVREHPWKWGVITFMAVGLGSIAYLVPGDPAVLWRPAAVFAGLTWLASGGITLYLYIRRTNPPGAEKE